MQLDSKLYNSTMETIRPQESKPDMVDLHNQATQSGCTSQEAALYALYFGDSMSLLDLSGPHLPLAEAAGYIANAAQKIENARAFNPEES